MQNINRLKLELNNKDYFTDTEYTIYLEENNLNPTEEYIKSNMQRNLLLTVVDVLEAVSNDTDLMRKVSDGTTDFSTSQAYKLLRERISDIKQRIANIPLAEEDYSNIGMLFTKNR